MSKMIMQVTVLYSLNENSEHTKKDSYWLVIGENSGVWLELGDFQSEATGRYFNICKAFQGVYLVKTDQTVYL